MLTQLFYKDKPIQGYFISDEGKIYDSNGVEQEQHIRSSSPYYFFKSGEVHQMMIHSFYGYKKGFDVHHLNQVKTDNRLENLVYLTREEHTKLHNIGNTNMLGKNHSEYTKQKMRASQHKKQVYCVQLDKVFEGVKIAAKELSLSAGHISKCCQGKRKTTGGYHFQFV